MMALILAGAAVLLLASVIRDVVVGQTGVVQLWGAHRSERPLLFWTYITGHIVCAIALLGLAKAISLP